MLRDINKKAMLLQIEPRDADLNFDIYRILQRHPILHAVSLPQRGF